MVLDDSEIERIAHALHAGPLAGHGFHYYEASIGFLIACGLVGLLYWRFRAGLFRHLNRKEQGETIQALKDMDTKTLKKILGDTNLPSWVQFPDFERVQWVNNVFAQIWPFFAVAYSGYAFKQLDPLLEQNKPAWIASITLNKFDLGDKPPIANGIKAYVGDAVGEEAILEVDFQWAGSQDVDLLVKPIPRYISAVPLAGALLSSLLRLKVGMEKLIFSGRVRISLKPLMNEFPCVAAAQIAFVEMPRFSFDLMVFGGDVSFLPGLEAWLKHFIAEYLIRPYLLPDKHVVPLVEGDPLGMELPRGLLAIKAIEAENVPKADILGRADPYLKLSVRATRVAKSEVRRNTGHPRWDENFKLLVHDPDVQELRVRLFDHDLLNEDDEIGYGSLKVADLTPGQEADVWIEIEEAGDEVEGDGLLANVRKAKNFVTHTGHKAIGKLAKKLTSEKKCRVHLKVTYFEFSEDEVHAAVGGDVANRPPGEQQPDSLAVNIMQGGVLYVRARKAEHLVRKPWYKLGLLGQSHAQLVVHVGHYTRRSVTSRGNDPVFADTLEFLLGADELRDVGDGDVRIEIWDNKLGIKFFRGAARVRLKDIVERKRLKDRFRLEGVDSGELAVEMRWLGVLDHQCDPQSFKPHVSQSHKRK